jgi:hypothetical protein
MQARSTQMKEQAIQIQKVSAPTRNEEPCNANRSERPRKLVEIDVAQKLSQWRCPGLPDLLTEFFRLALNI